VRGRIISTVDPEIRHGRKSSQTRFDGYKLSAAATNTNEPLITAVQVAAAGETDGLQAKHLIDAQPSERRPVRVLGDTAYGNGPVRAELAQRGVEVLAPVPAGKIEENVLGKQDFEIDLSEGTVTCPGGHTVPIWTTSKGYSGASFTPAMCGTCPVKERCCPGRRRRQIRIMEHEHLLQTGRHALQDPDRSEHLRRTRPRIERLLGLLAHRYRARRSRYIGSAKARLQAAWAAALVNLNPIRHRLAAQTA
jgi:hypothetical protein